MIFWMFWWNYKRSYNCLFGGELLNRVKIEMNYTINYYRKLYESLIVYSIWKSLQEKKKY